MRKIIGAFHVPAGVECLGIIDHELLFADMRSRMYGNSTGRFYYYSDAFTFVEPSLVSAVSPAGVVAPVTTGKKRGRKSWQALEIAF